MPARNKLNMSIIMRLGPRHLNSLSLLISSCLGTGRLTFKGRQFNITGTDSLLTMKDIDRPIMHRRQPVAEHQLKNSDKLTILGLYRAQGGDPTMKVQFNGITGGSMGQYTADRRGQRSARSNSQTEGDTVTLGRQTGPAGSERDSDVLRLVLNRSGTLTSTNQPRTAFRDALRALPRDDSGRYNPDSIAQTHKRRALNNAIERLMLEGLGAQAEAQFTIAVERLFSEYAENLGLNEHELEMAREMMLSEVKSAVKTELEIKPWNPFDEGDGQSKQKDTALKAVQNAFHQRRQALMEAAGNLSGVLAELTVDAEDGDTAATRALGDFLSRFNEAVQARSTQNLRQTAKGRLLNPRAPANIDGAHIDKASTFLGLLYNTG